MLEMPGKRWKLTAMGRAVYDSAMPPDIAVKMYQELEAKILQGFSLHEPLQAIFVLLGAGKTPVTSIFDWAHWHQKFVVRHLTSLIWLPNLKGTEESIPGAAIPCPGQRLF